MRIYAQEYFCLYTVEAYGMISETMRDICRNFLLEDLAAVVGPGEINGTIVVQVSQNIEETRRLLGFARRHAMVKGVAGWALLAGSNAVQALEALAQRPLSKEVWHAAHDEPNPAFLADAAFDDGVRSVTARGLAYDLLIRARQLKSAIALVNLHPRQAFVLDNVAKQAVRNTPDARWCRLFPALAPRRNGGCKILALRPGWRKGIGPRNCCALISPRFWRLTDRGTSCIRLRPAGPASSPRGMRGAALRRVLRCGAFVAREGPPFRRHGS